MRIVVVTDDNGADMPIATIDDAGNVVVRPVRAKGEDVGAYLERLYAWKNTITVAANDAFDEAFRRAMRAPRKK